MIRVAFERAWVQCLPMLAANVCSLFLLPCVSHHSVGRNSKRNMTAHSRPAAAGDFVSAGLA